jgi:hypothetical protein
MTQTQILEWVRSPPRMAGGAQEKIGAISPQTILYSPTAAPKSLRPPPAMPFSAPDARIELIVLEIRANGHQSGAGATKPLIGIVVFHSALRGIAKGHGEAEPGMTRCEPI